RYSPDQPRYPAGSAEGGQWTGGTISPITAGSTQPAAGREGIATTDPTRLDNLTDAYRAKLAAKLDEQFPGMTQEQLEANVEEQLKLALADPNNAGQGWYEEAHAAAQQLADDYGVSLETATGMIAGMSPQHNWGSNLAASRYTAELLQADPYINDADLSPELSDQATNQLAGKGVVRGAWDGTRRLSDMEPMEASAAIKAYDKAAGLQYVDDVNGKDYGVTWSCGLNGISTAVTIYRGASPDDVLGGHKVRSFYNNIYGGADSNGSVTVDTHAVSAALGEKVTAVDPRMGKIMASPSNREFSTKGVYPMIADAYRTVAVRYGMTPEDVQAMVWLQWRAAHP
ncbi:MAG TPA: hypothetical protein VM285_05495, partial [Polyangia bacterium]|nr:hypothetical protein [Polyangia bacterium]